MAGSLVPSVAESGAVYPALWPARRSAKMFEKGPNPMEVASKAGRKSMRMLGRYATVEAAKVAARVR